MTEDARQGYAPGCLSYKEGGRGMNTYAVLVWLVESIHVLLVIFFVGGFFVSIDRHRTFRLLHSISLSALLPIQLLFDFNCPLWCSMVALEN